MGIRDTGNNCSLFVGRLIEKLLFGGEGAQCLPANSLRLKWLDSRVIPDSYQWLVCNLEISSFGDYLQTGVGTNSAFMQRLCADAMMLFSRVFFNFKIKEVHGNTNTNACQQMLV